MFSLDLFFKKQARLLDGCAPSVIVRLADVAEVVDVAHVANVANVADVADVADVLDLADVADVAMLPMLLMWPMWLMWPMNFDHLRCPLGEGEDIAALLPLPPPASS